MSVTRRLMFLTVVILLLVGCGGAPAPDTATPTAPPAPQTVPSPEGYPDLQTFPTPEGYPAPQDVLPPDPYPSPESSDSAPAVALNDLVRFDYHIQ